MFTGLVESVGHVIAADRIGKAMRLKIEAERFQGETQIGDSVAINGCCLTVVSEADGRFDFDAGDETLLKTNLGDLQVGSMVNLERALLPTSRLGGHFVSGHIDCTAKVKSRVDEKEWSTLWFQLAPEWTRLMAPKGSVAVDGISLTLVNVIQDAFSVMLIPHTLQVTTLGQRKVNETVNIETDILAKYTQKLMTSGSLSQQSLSGEESAKS